MTRDHPSQAFLEDLDPDAVRTGTAQDGSRHHGDQKRRGTVGTFNLRSRRWRPSSDLALSSGTWRRSVTDER
jgi:hypothetical protein